MDESQPAVSAQVGSADADLLAFYDEHVAGLFAFVARRCSDQQLAEDLTQEVFMLATRQCSRAGEVPPVGWLYRVARNKLIDHWRRETRRERKLRLVTARVDENWGPDPADNVVSAHEVSEALSRLPADQRAVLVMRYMDNSSTAQIAESLGRSTKAIESLLARARKRLGESFEAQTDA